jgi:hypothetical protein
MVEENAGDCAAYCTLTYDEVNSLMENEGICDPVVP